MSMTGEQQRNVFRMAAIIYGRSNNGISLNKSYQRVIDDALYSCGRLSIPITELIVYINKEYGFLFSVDEINSVVIKGRDADQRYYCYTENNDTIVSLTGEYKNKLSLVCGQKTLYEYIDEYLISLDIEKESSKALILRFLYEMFTSNLEGYKLILQEKIDAIEVKSNNYTDKEKEIINNFLAWPDEGKDKAIYDLAGYSLEYCMMTNQKNTSLNIQNLKGKSFYIDTNVIYRALGLNSDNLKVRTHLFLSKFKEVGESLVISQSTYLEFIDTIDYYIGKIDNSLRPRVQSKVISEFISEDSVFHYYHKWCIGRVNRSTSYFKDWIMSEFDSLCKKYEIIHDRNYPYNIEERKSNINEYVSGIMQSDLEKQETSAEYDAENVLWIEEKRKGSGDDIYQVKAFFLSSDNKLRRWDYLRNTHRVPVVMSPNQWLNIVLHYIERTADDYKSFVSFLTLNIRTSALPLDMLSAIVSGIAEATSDIEQQQTLVRNFIERNTFDEMEKMSDNDLESEAEKFAKTELEKRIEELELKQKEQEQQLAQTHVIIKNTQQTLSEVKRTSANELRKIEQQRNAERRAKETVEKDNALLRKIIATNKLKKWKTIKIVIWIVALLISMALGLLIFIFKDKSWNFMALLVSKIDNLGNTSAKQYGEWLVGLPIVFGIYAIKMIIDAIDVDDYNSLRLFRKSKKT